MTYTGRVARPPATTRIARPGTTEAGPGRRRAPSDAEQARRKAWGREWAAVAKTWKHAHNPKG